MFTVNPVSKKENEMQINASYGLGESVVSGRVSADSYIVDKNGEINDNVIKKAYRKKMKEVHPDKNSNIDATAQSQKINAINEFLKEQLEYYLIQRRRG